VFASLCGVSKRAWWTSTACEAEGRLQRRVRQAQRSTQCDLYLIGHPRSLFSAHKSACPEQPFTAGDACFQAPGMRDFEREEDARLPVPVVRPASRIERSSRTDACIAHRPQFCGSAAAAGIIPYLLTRDRKYLRFVISIQVRSDFRPADFGLLISSVQLCSSKQRLTCDRMRTSEGIFSLIRELLADLGHLQAAPGYFRRLFNNLRSEVRGCTHTSIR